MTLPTEELIACPHCDALHRAEVPRDGARARCRRCGTVLIAPQAGSFLRVVALALTVAILMGTAVFLPFLEVHVRGLGNAASVFDAILIFAGGPMTPLALAVAALIVFIPVLRVLLVAYTLAPLSLGRPPWPYAAAAFRASEDLRPWSMAEIFIIGVAVALIKVTDLATVALGPAFWMFAALVVVLALQDGTMCRWSIWTALDRTRR